MLLLLLFFGILLLYAVLYFLIPKGILIHELIHLPIYWIRMFSTNTRDLIEEKYSYGTHRKQYLLHLKSKTIPAEKQHVAIYIHGGGWRFGSPKFFKPNALFLAQQGFEVFLPSHRKTPRYKFNDQVEDIAEAVKLALQILKKAGKSNKKIIIGGISSGGHLSASLLAREILLKKFDIPKSVFSGAFLLAAPLNLRLMRQTFIVKSLIGKDCSNANPYENISREERIPYLIIQGEKDGMVDAFSTLSYADKFNFLNPDILQFELLKNGTHLDAGKWMFQQDQVGTILSQWLRQIDSP